MFKYRLLLLRLRLYHNPCCNGSRGVGDVDVGVHNESHFVMKPGSLLCSLSTPDVVWNEPLWDFCSKKRYKKNSVLMETPTTY